MKHTRELTRIHGKQGALFLVLLHININMRLHSPFPFRFWDDGTPQYFNIVDKLSEMVSVRHEMTYTQYAYKDSINGGLVSYDDEQAICDKTEYALENELNGFIIWVSTTAWIGYIFSDESISHM